MLNKFIAMGRLTADPELKTTQGGIPVTAFTLAVDRSYQQGGEKKTDFFRCVAWRNTAEFITKYFRKGKLMAIEAEMQSRTYENRDGNKVTVWEAIVQNAYFGGDKSEGNGTAQTGGYDIDVDDEDLPF